MSATQSASTISPAVIAVICIALALSLSLAAFANWFCRYRARFEEETSIAASSIFVQLQSRLAKEPQQKLPTIHDLDMYVPVTTYKIWRGQQSQKRSDCPGPAVLCSLNNIAISNLPAPFPHSPAETPIYLPIEKGNDDQNSIALYRERSGGDNLVVEFENSDHCTCGQLDKTFTNDTCAICLDVIGDEHGVRGLACHHAFHESCITKWLMSWRACCPVCKSNFRTGSGFIV